MENTFLHGFRNVHSHPDRAARQSWMCGHMARSSQGWASEFLQMGRVARGTRPARTCRSFSSVSRLVTSPQVSRELGSSVSFISKLCLLTTLSLAFSCAGELMEWGGRRSDPWACALTDFSGGGERQGGEPPWLSVWGWLLPFTSVAHCQARPLCWEADTCRGGRRGGGACMPPTPGTPRSSVAFPPAACTTLSTFCSSKNREGLSGLLPRESIF